MSCSLQTSDPTKPTMNGDSQQHLHIGVLAFPFGTHAAPLLTLVRRLAAGEPTLKFSFLSTAKSNRQTFSGAKANQFDNIKVFDVWDGVAEGDEFGGNVHVAAGLFMKATPENFKRGMEAAAAGSGVKISCLLTDAFLWFAGDLAAEMEVPWVPYWTAGSCSLSIHFYTDLIRTTLGNVNTGILENIDKTLKFIPGLSAVSVDDLPDGIILGNLESPIAQMLHNMGLKLPKAAAVVLNSFEELEPATAKDLKSKLQKVLHVGPSILSSPAPSDSDETGCLLWLDNQKPASVAYISFGTITTPPPNEVLALAETLVSSKVPFLWSLRDHSRHLFPKGFVENTVAFGKVVSWAPQLQVLAHPSVGVFVTHCGWNSILESITGGVPMICRPFFGDQTLNSRMVQDAWRIGVRVEGGVFTKSGTTSSLELVLSQEEGKKMRENIKVLKQNAIEAVGPNGSSSENFKDLLEVIKA
ncbi:unnamed protein product [Camellia sinensis]